VPARELLAEMLLAQNRFADALREYEAVMVKEPNRYRALAGGMAAARGAGEQAKAQAMAALVSGARRRLPACPLQQARKLAGG
jgi:hypothetical protein